MAVGLAAMTAATDAGACVSLGYRDCDGERAGAFQMPRQEPRQPRYVDPTAAARRDPFGVAPSAGPYRQEPTLGDPRRFRQTDPRTCTGLLCN